MIIRCLDRETIESLTTLESAVGRRKLMFNRESSQRRACAKADGWNTAVHLKTVQCALTVTELARQKVKEDSALNIGIEQKVLIAHLWGKSREVNKEASLMSDMTSF